MQRKLFVVLSLVVLLSLAASTAFAAEPAKTNATQFSYEGEWMLGEVVEAAVVAFDPITNIVLPYHAVDVWLYRPQTIAFEPWFPAEWGLAGEWIKEDFDSGLRRQSWPKYQMSDAFGFYYFKFMLPRDEVWYPCSFPCKWKCNYYNPFYGWDFHSPKVLWFSYPDAWTLTHMPLFWPWDLDWVDPWLGPIGAYGPPPFYLHYDYPVGQDATPFDTVHPMEMWVVEPVSATAMYLFEMKIVGYRWRTTDVQIEYYEEWPYLCGDPYEWPDYDLIESWAP